MFLYYDSSCLLCFVLVKSDYKSWAGPVHQAEFFRQDNSTLVSRNKNQLLDCIKTKPAYSNVSWGPGIEMT